MAVVHFVCMHLHLQGGSTLHVAAEAVEGPLPMPTAPLAGLAVSAVVALVALVALQVREPWHTDTRITSYRHALCMQSTLSLRMTSATCI
jgi:hypothetical protein